ncbi:MAG: radical SAM protein [Proteobacteria bacterium]|nr:radical SAM protein [Pseudomonadota bacterium]
MQNNSGQSVKREIFRRLPYWTQLQVARAYCLIKKRRVLRRGAVRTLIFFVTSRCNLRCSHCFLWQKLDDKHDELDLDEIRKVAENLTDISSLSLTGGEPFLRNDLNEIARIFCKQRTVRSLGIATNGTLGDRVLPTVETLLEEHVVPELSIQVSLDGLETTHDLIRSKSGAFRKAEATLFALLKLRQRFPTLSVHAALAVQNANLDELEDFIERFRSQRVPLRFNIVRGGSFGVFQLPRQAYGSFDPRDKEESFLSLEELKKIYEILKRKNEDGGFRFWSERQERIWQLSLGMIEQGSGVMPCYASAMEGVLYSDGLFGHCELSKPFANVRDYNYDLGKVWASEEGVRMRRLLKRCACIHGCNLTTALTFEPETVLATLRDRR